MTNDRKERKKAQVKKNRRLQEIFALLRRQGAEAERIRDDEESRKPKSGESRKEAHTDKVAVIRNRLTSQKRISKERWNRFAGTGGEGGRGL